MENASKAFLIAGGVLIAIITITLFVYMFGNLATIRKAEDEKSTLEEISAWNEEWKAYEKTYLYGAEVLTVLNKAKDNNIDKAYKVNVEIYSNTTTKINNMESYLKLHKTNIFSCEEMKDNDGDGRIDYVKFRFVE